MLADLLAEFFEKNPEIKNQADYAIAVSGGPDSMALAHALLKTYPDKKFHLVTVDHGLRKEAKKEAEKVRIFFAAYENATHCILKWEDKKPENAVMEQARRARYALLDEYCFSRNIKTVFIGHHQDDQAETFLIRLSKGSGLDGLTSMQSLSKRDHIMLARPFLSVPKVELISYCEQNNVVFVDDPTNESSNYMRPRLRQSMKVLEAEGLTAKRLFVTAKRLERAREAIIFYTKKISEEALIREDKDQTILDFEILQQAPEEISFRIIQNLIEGQRSGYDYNVRMEKLEDLFESLMNNSKNYKPRTLGGCLITLNKNQLVIEKEKK
jgi:tRNA(Ile)-lysidine synthase